MLFIDLFRSVVLQMLVYEFMSNGTLRDWISGCEFSGIGLS